MYEDILGYLGSFDILRLYKEIMESIGYIWMHWDILDYIYSRIYLIYLNIMVYIRIHLDIMGYIQV